MSLVRMGNHFAYTINGPQSNAVDLPIRPLKSPSVRREPKFSGNNLRNLYQNPVSLTNHRTSLSPTENGALTPATPVLPPTPPNVEEDIQTVADVPISAADVVKNRSILTTPVNQVIPLTPDNTPPRERPWIRPWMGGQSSLSSMRAESFRTALEDLPSDKESITSSATSQHDLNQPTHILPAHLNNSVYRPSPLANLPITNKDLASKESSPLVISAAAIPSIDSIQNSKQSFLINDHGSAVKNQELNMNETVREVESLQKQDEVNEEQRYKIRSRKEGAKRGQSLRERLENSRQIPHSPSVDKFASIIGWSNTVQDSTETQRRWSGVSDTSAVGAYLIEPPRLPKKRNTLRHVSKNDSLRSASSPLPNSNRTSMQSSSDSPHRLVHKKAKLSNQNRLSFGSEVSRSLSLGSNVVPKVEVIQVAVIPERSSSLQRSTTSSRRHSVSTTGAPTSFRTPRGPDSAHRRRATTDATDRGRDRHYPPQVPPQVPTRGSSLSAPTSRNVSRTNSVSSDNFRFERKRAEKDLRTTLDRMELERLTSSLKGGSIDTMSRKASDSQPDVRAHDFASGVDPYPQHITPGSSEWAELRPTSTLHTPFSQPSFMSASPEISEAKMISLHVHNNHSVQLIEPFPLQDSHAVQEARKLNAGASLQIGNTNSPLRNPRQPPAPPRFQVIPATPQDEVEAPMQLPAPQLPGPTTPKHPTIRPNIDSPAKNLIRIVSLRNAKNKKADQELDSSLHPFWRPRPFWDGIEGGSPEKKREVGTEERGIINNSLGLPQQRLVITGPFGLVRKFSENRRNRKFVVKQSSYSSLQRLRTGKKLMKLPGLGTHVQLLSFKNIQERIASSREKREDEKREKRRDALRKSIGPNVIATGDSRFPTTGLGDTGLRRE